MAKQTDFPFASAIAHDIFEAWNPCLLLMQSRLSAVGCSWRLVHESPPLKGNPYNSLPASVLEVSESSLSGIYSVQFMCHMGCTITYKVGRQNWVYVCSHEGAEVQVRRSQ
jgi:hypothetical protein